ncbi:MAG: 2'-5' RNA ligase family protein [Acinetobacter sp.]
MFLQPHQLTIPTETHNYPEWHKGREEYALWYIEIDQPELIAYLNQLRQQFSNYLLQPNIRQFHITLFICGFLKQDCAQLNDDFSQNQFQQQLAQLENTYFKTFKLSTGQIKSFESALFVEILDTENSLSKIRKLFSSCHQEIAALDYCSHITLGLYQAAFESEQIFEEISVIQKKTFEISINKLTFGFYKAKILQGELYPMHQYKLGQYNDQPALFQE